MLTSDVEFGNPDFPEHTGGQSRKRAVGKLCNTIPPVQLVLDIMLACRLEPQKQRPSSPRCYQHLIICHGAVLLILEILDAMFNILKGHIAQSWKASGIKLAVHKPRHKSDLRWKLLKVNVGAASLVSSVDQVGLKLENGR